MIFCMKINIKVFYKLVGSFLLVMVRHAQGTQNMKFEISLQYLFATSQKIRRDEVDFLYIIKLSIRHQTFLQADTIDLGWHDLACPNNPK